MLVSAKHQHESAIGIAVSPPSHLPPIPLLWVVIEPRCEFPESHGKFPWASISHLVVWMSPCYSLHTSQETVAAVWLTFCLSRIPQWVSQLPCRDKPCGEATGWGTSSPDNSQCDNGLRSGSSALSWIEGQTLGQHHAANVLRNFCPLETVRR